MTKQVFDNSAKKELNRVVLWQYDHAYNLLKLLHLLANNYIQGVERFWNDYPLKVLGIDTAEKIGQYDTRAFGLTTWGIMLGQPRPKWLERKLDDWGVELAPATLMEVSDELYRKILKARFELFRSNSSLSALVKYVNMIWGCPSDPEKSGVLIKDLGNMAMTYEMNQMQRIKDKSKSCWDDMTDEQKAIFIAAKIYPRTKPSNQLLFYPANVRYNWSVSGAKASSGAVGMPVEDLIVYPSAVSDEPSSSTLQEYVFGFAEQNEGRTDEDPIVQCFAYDDVPPEKGSADDVRTKVRGTTWISQSTIKRLVGS